MCQSKYLETEATNLLKKKTPFSLLLQLAAANHRSGAAVRWMFCPPPNFHCGQSQQSWRWTCCLCQLKGSWKFYVCLRTDARSHSVVNHRDVVMWGKHGSWWNSGPTKRSCPWCWSCSISWLKRHYQTVLMPRGTSGFWRFDRSSTISRIYSESCVDLAVVVLPPVLY